MTLEQLIASGVLSLSHAVLITVTSMNKMFIQLLLKSLINLD